MRWPEAFVCVGGFAVLVAGVVGMLWAIAQ